MMMNTGGTANHKQLIVSATLLARVSAFLLGSGFAVWPTVRKRTSVGLSPHKPVPSRILENQSHQSFDVRQIPT